MPSSSSPASAASPALFAALIALTQNRSQARAGLLDSEPARLHVPGPGQRRPLGRANRLVTFAVVAAMFHLFTHAFFKALLFLSAGSVMHAMGNVIDMRRFSGLRKVLPLHALDVSVRRPGLGRLPAVLGLLEQGRDPRCGLGQRDISQEYANWYLFLWLVGFITAGLTAFYTFRAYFLTFWGELRIPQEAKEHHGHAQQVAHIETGPHHHGPTDTGPHTHAPHETGEHGYESPPVMTVPLMILAVFAWASVSRWVPHGSF